MSWKFFLLLIVVCLIIQGFFAMLEMACVSFNKVRLLYYVNKNKRPAIWISKLLKQPAQLFGTTLIGVNTALQIGSEAARHFYISLGLSPDWAPLSQVFIVLIFAEIGPLIAGRRFAEHAAMIGAGILYFLSIVLKPIIWLFDLLCRFVNRLLGQTGDVGLYLTREELQKILEEREEGALQHAAGEDFNPIVSNIFSLKAKTAKDLMQPLEKEILVPSTCTIKEMRQLLNAHFTPYVPIYHRNERHIVAIAYPRDLLRLQEHKKVQDHARPPWFITEKTSILQILKQFRKNNQSVAVVLNETGHAIGLLTLDEVIDEIFGQFDRWMSFGEMMPRMHHVIVDRTFPSDMKIAEFNRQFRVHLSYEGDETFEELMTRILGHPPEKAESVRLDQFELTIEEAPLLGEKMVAVRTVY